MAKNSVRITLNLPAELVNRLKDESEKKDITMTEEIRRSLENELFLSKEEEDGAKILLERKDNRMVQLVRK